MAEEKENQIVSLVKASSNVLCQFYQDLAQPSVKALGQALATVFELCPNSLLSLKLWTEKRKLNFAKRLNEYKEKLEQIPEEKRIEVDTQIGTPIVERLTYTTNDAIADLFTTLLANASNIDTVNSVHPAFVQIVSELCPDEAHIIQFLFFNKAICYIKHLFYPIDVFDLLENNISLSCPKNREMYYSHLISLGVLVENQRPFTNFRETANDEIDAQYKVLEKKIGEFNKTISDFNNCLNPSIGEILKPVDNFKDIDIYNRGFYCLTKFGEFFAKACIRYE